MTKKMGSLSAIGILLIVGAIVTANVFANSKPSSNSAVCNCATCCEDGSCCCETGVCSCKVCSCSCDCCEDMRSSSATAKAIEEPTAAHCPMCKPGK